MTKRSNHIDDIDSTTLPKHIAIIMDGNGRWAESKNKSRIQGHKKGVETLREIIKACSQLNISYLSAYAFSTENWKRPKREVTFLMNLLNTMIEKEINNLKKNNIKVNIFGKKTNLEKKLLSNIELIEKTTKECSGLTLNLMINYGSRDEIITAVNAIKNCKELSDTTITEDTFKNYLYTCDIPDPEILIRTSGEKRISNFLLWQISYSELYFTKTPWPEFSQKELQEIIKDYQSRNRRFGGL
tara:strand:- start:6281 stop:7009 length:729 start_codon:yes stop_codon:yes gene_type:complete